MKFIPFPENNFYLFFDQIFGWKGNFNKDTFSRKNCLAGLDLGGKSFRKRHRQVFF
jgi:hypothetical protein